MGLLPDSLDLRKFMLSLLTEQIVGYYDPTTKVLYIVQGASDEMVGVTVSHELVHALQDQYINLDSLQKVQARERSADRRAGGHRGAGDVRAALGDAG